MFGKPRLGTGEDLSVQVESMGGDLACVHLHPTAACHKYGLVDQQGQKQLLACPLVLDSCQVDLTHGQGVLDLAEVLLERGFSQAEVDELVSAEVVTGNQGPGTRR